MQGVAFFSSISPLLPFLPSPFLPSQPLRLSSGSLRPCRHHEPVRLPFWLLARFVDALAPFACAVHCPHGSTVRSSTKSCVYSTHHFPRTLNSLPSSLQRISLALQSLLLHRALPGPQLLFLLLAPPEPFSPLLLAPHEPLLLSLAPPALSSAPLAPPLRSLLFLFFPFVFFLI